MSEPKFQIGEIVAVHCWPRYKIIIPKTVVTEVRQVRAGQVIEGANLTFIVQRDCYFYCVADDPGVFAEEYLRKLDPDEIEAMMGEVSVSA